MAKHVSGALYLPDADEETAHVWAGECPNVYACHRVDRCGNHWYRVDLSAAQEWGCPVNLTGWVVWLATREAGDCTFVAGESFYRGRRVR